LCLWCRDRIANQVFDDPPRVLPPEPEKAKVSLEMDDKKSHKVCIPHALSCVPQMCRTPKAIALNVQLKCATKFAFTMHFGCVTKMYQTPKAVQSGRAL